MSSYYFIGQSFPAAAAVVGTTGVFSGNVSSGGQFLAASGTANAPGYAFTAESTMGMYRVSAGLLGLTAAGVQVAQFSSTLAVLPAASVLTWNASSKLTATSNGFLQLTNNAGTNPSANAMGMIFGTNDASGASLTRSAAGKLRVMTGNQGANGIFEAASYATTNSGSTTASYAGAGANEAGVGLGFDDGGSAATAWCTTIGHRRLVATKTVSYTVVHMDSGKVFDNTGDATAAPGTVFTLPAATLGASVVGEYFTFVNTSTGGFQLKAVGSDVIKGISDIAGTNTAIASSAGGTVTTGTAAGVGVLVGQSVTLQISSAGVWNMLGSTGNYFAA